MGHGDGADDGLFTGVGQPEGAARRKFTGVSGRHGDGVKTVTVSLSAEGLPVSFELDGSTWFVGAEPVRWFERRAWWETDRRMGRPGEARRIEVEVWQLQARLGRNPSSELVTFEIVHDEVGQWLVRVQS